jgi:hypothetical protein
LAGGELLVVADDVIVALALLNRRDESVSERVDLVGGVVLITPSLLPSQWRLQGRHPKRKFLAICIKLP